MGHLYLQDKIVVPNHCDQLSRATRKVSDEATPGNTTKGWHIFVNEADGVTLKILKATGKVNSN